MDGAPFVSLDTLGVCFVDKLVMFNSIHRKSTALEKGEKKVMDPPLNTPTNTCELFASEHMVIIF